jgi:hypothetical protein
MLSHMTIRQTRHAGVPLTLICFAALLLFGCSTREHSVQLDPADLPAKAQALDSCQYLPTDRTLATDSSAGGPVIPHIRLHSIYWDNTVRFPEDRDHFYQSIVNSPYLDWLSEYSPVVSTTQPSQVGISIGRGSFIDSMVDSGAPAPIATEIGRHTITEDMIQRRLKQLIQANLFHNETPSPVPIFQGYQFTNDVYLIHTPPTVSVSLANGAGYACPDPRDSGNPPGTNVEGFHEAMVLDNRLVWYVVLPDCGCGPQDQTGRCRVALSEVFDNLTVTASHEIVETITDPNMNAWGPEIGDKCVNAPQARVNGYEVQMVWSNSQRKCIATACGCNDFSRDRTNCGRCGRVCPTDFACRDSDCACLYPNVLCGDQCINTANDPSRCGGCNNPCPNSNWSCVNSSCVCQAPHRMCGTACVDTQVDSHNCGDCNHQCLGGTICDGSQCVRQRSCAPTTCHAPYHCCDDGFGHLSCVGPHVECQ